MCRDVLRIIYDGLPIKAARAMAMTCRDWNASFYTSSHWSRVLVQGLTEKALPSVLGAMAKSGWAVNALGVATASREALTGLAAGMKEHGASLHRFELILQIGDRHLNLDTFCSSLPPVKTLRIFCPTGSWSMLYGSNKLPEGLEELLLKNCSSSVHVRALPRSLKRLVCAKCEWVIFDGVEDGPCLEKVRLISTRSPTTIYLGNLTRMHTFHATNCDITFMGTSTALRSLVVDGRSTIRGRLEAPPYAEDYHFDDAGNAAVFERLPKTLCTLHLETHSQPLEQVGTVDFSDFRDMTSLSLCGFNIGTIILGPKVSEFVSMKNDVEVVDCTLAAGLKTLAVMEYGVFEPVNVPPGCTVTVHPFSAL
jgi:hypothetical protein